MENTERKRFINHPITGFLDSSDVTFTHVRGNLRIDVGGRRITLSEQEIQEFLRWLGQCQNETEVAG